MKHIVHGNYECGGPSNYLKRISTIYIPLGYVHLWDGCISNYYWKMYNSVHLYHCITARLCWHAMSLYILKNSCHVRWRENIMRPSISHTQSKSSYNWIPSLRCQRSFVKIILSVLWTGIENKIQVVLTFLHNSLSLFRKNWKRCDRDDIVQTWFATAGKLDKSTSW